MRTLLFLSSVAMSIVLTFARATWGDGVGPSAGDEHDLDPDDTTEPITGEAVMPNPGDEQPMRDPFTPYDIGGEAAAWRLEDLTPEEQVVAARGLDEDQSAIQEAYAEVARDMAEQARDAAVTSELGVAQLAGLGVVP